MVILSLTRGWILTEALRHMDHQHPTGSHNSKNLESMGENTPKGEGWISLVKGGGGTGGWGKNTQGQPNRTQQG